MTLSAYALPTRCPVLSEHMVLSAYALPTQSPVLSSRTVVPGRAGCYCRGAHAGLPPYCHSVRCYRPTRYTVLTKRMVLSAYAMHCTDIL
eukprot:383327-Rhodomonas_salina.1